VQSPLAKRKKLSAARRGSSRLKVGLSAEDLHDDDAGEREESDGDAEEDAEAEGDAEEEGRVQEEQESAASTDGNGVDDDDEDDFLAREMAEEWG
jgi:RNA polymerase II subunit A-like phosphatase